MKKILSIVLTVALISAVCALCASAFQQRTAGGDVAATSGWEIHNIDDEVYCQVYDITADEVVSTATMAATGDGLFAGTNNCVQVYHGPTHLCSSNSVGLTSGAKLVFKFNGTGIHLGACFRDQVGPTGIEIYVDGVKQEANPYAANEAVPDFNDDKHIVPAIIAGVENLPAGNHVVEFVGTTAVRLSADWYEVPTGTTAYNPATADMTAVVALIGVVACAGVVVAAKKH